jgi:hypothetical protein
MPFTSRSTREELFPDRKLGPVCGSILADEAPDKSRVFRPIRSLDFITAPGLAAARKAPLAAHGKAIRFNRNPPRHRLDERGRSDLSQRSSDTEGVSGDRSERNWSQE